MIAKAALCIEINIYIQKCICLALPSAAISIDGSLQLSIGLFFV